MVYRGTKYIKHRTDGNWWEGLRQMQAIMFQVKLWDLDEAKEYLKNHNLEYVGNPKVVIRKNITYHKFILVDVRQELFPFLDYKADHVGFGVYEITAINDGDR